MKPYNLCNRTINLNAILSIGQVVSERYIPDGRWSWLWRLLAGPDALTKPRFSYCVFFNSGMYDMAFFPTKEDAISSRSMLVEACCND